LDRHPAERALEATAKAEHQWSGDHRRRVFEGRKFEAIIERLEIAIKKSRSRFGWFWRNSDWLTWSLLVMTRCEEGDNALMTRVCRLVNALVKLRRYRKDQRKKKCGSKPGNGDRAYGDYIAV
jgi:hypothetical protein